MESEANYCPPSEETRKARGSFTGKVGFVLAAAGSAVGLGNLWRFPYLADKFGGGAFLLTYVILMVFFGIALMMTEIALGRKTGKSCIDAFRDISEKHSFIGWLAAIVPIIIVPYYCVIGGWVTKYFVEFSIGNHIGVTAAGSADFFNQFMTCGMAGVFDSPVTWFLIFSLLAIIVVAFGVEKGIEKVSKYLMPVLFILMIGICVYILFLPADPDTGITVFDGIKHYIVPNMDDFNSKTILGAVGQLFYSMSLAMGIMITYGSYMKKDVNIAKSATQISVMDTGVAFMAGLMIIPPMFMLGENMGSGPGLMFVSLPVVFEAMPGGQVVGALFFFLVIIAALTSAISLAETVVSVFHDRLHWKRSVSSFAVMILILGLGILSCLGYGPLDAVCIGGMYFLDIFDAVSNSILMPIVAILTCLFVGFVVKPKFVTDELEADGSTFKYKTVYSYLIKYVCPIILVFVLITGLLSTFGIWKI